VYGKIRLVVDAGGSKVATVEERLREALVVELVTLRASLGPYAPRDFLISSLRLLLPDEVFDNPNKVPLADNDDDDAWTLDRQISADGWTVASATDAAASRRAVLFGLKGGVGRTTATAEWARYLARQDKTVLVIDLDLEAPGVGSSLLARKDWPRAGLVDWLVEDAVGQGEAVIDDMVGRVSELHDGSILVFPASGKDEDHYLHKLGRAFAQVPQRGNASRLENFAMRMKRLLVVLEVKYQPDAVLIDARAGLHDLSAAALVALGGHHFLFALDSPQTWSGYRHLLRHWNLEHPRWRELRERLQFVMGQVPEISREDYVTGFNDKAYELLAALCYDESKGGEIPNFHPARHETSAPHIGWQIGWSLESQTYDPLGSSVTAKQIDAAFGSFFRRATARLFDDADESGEHATEVA